jgi:hypothetical protein
MKQQKMHTGCVFLVVWLFAFTAWSQPSDFEERHGDFWGMVSFGLGFAHALEHETSSGVDAAGTMGLGFTVRVGLEITPDLFGSVEIGQLYKDAASPDGWAYYTRLVPMLLYYPVETLGLYGKFGAGLLLRKESNQSDTESGFDARLGLGYEIRIHNRFSVSLEGSYDLGLLGAGIAQEFSGTLMLSMFF